MSSPLVIAAVNRKGGVGKSTTLFHLAGHWAAAGRRVLVVDNDPQHSLTGALLGPAAADALAPSATVAALFDDGPDPDPGFLIRPTPIPGLDLLPGSDELAHANTTDPEGLADRPAALRDFLGVAKSGYDLVLIDNPPNLQLCTWAALLAADAVYVPFQPEDFGCQGVVAVSRCIALAVRRANPRLTTAGYLLNMANPRLALHRAYEGLLRRTYGALVFDATLPPAAALKESISRGQPVSRYRPRGAAARAVAAVAEELLARAAAPAVAAGNSGASKRKVG